MWTVIVLVFWLLVLPTRALPISIAFTTSRTIATAQDLPTPRLAIATTASTRAQLPWHVLLGPFTVVHQVHVCRLRGVLPVRPHPP